VSELPKYAERQLGEPLAVVLLNAGPCSCAWRLVVLPAAGTLRAPSRRVGASLHLCVHRMHLHRMHLEAF
jgi:hypothetical protein